MKPAEYWRANKSWKEWLNRQGTVVASTTIEVASPEHMELTPYSLVLVDFGTQKLTLMGAGHEIFNPGDTVTCVLRKVAVPTETDLIPYGIKVKKLR